MHRMRQHKLRASSLGKGVCDHMYGTLHSQAKYIYIARSQPFQMATSAPRRQNMPPRRIRRHKRQKTYKHLLALQQSTRHTVSVPLPRIWKVHTLETATCKQRSPLAVAGALFQRQACQVTVFKVQVATHTLPVMKLQDNAQYCLLILLIMHSLKVTKSVSQIASLHITDILGIILTCGPVGRKCCLCLVSCRTCLNLQNLSHNDLRFSIWCIKGHKSELWNMTLIFAGIFDVLEVSNFWITTLIFEGKISVGPFQENWGLTKVDTKFAALLCYWDSVWCSVTTICVFFPSFIPPRCCAFVW